MRKKGEERRKRREKDGGKEEGGEEKVREGRGKGFFLPPQYRSGATDCVSAVCSAVELCCLLRPGAVVQLVEYRNRKREVAGSTHTRSTASNLEQVANLLCAQANSASYPQRDGK